MPEGGWSPPKTRSEVFESMAAGHESAAPLLAMLYRRCASDPLALSLIPDPPTWDMPHRLLAAARWLVLSGEVDDFEEAHDPLPAFRAVLAEHGEWIARFVREHPVQTNDVQRCWVLLPIFLTIAKQVRRPLDLVELGPSAGLNLLWDRYGYAYAAGSWGDSRSPLQLSGEERSPVPAELLETAVEVRSRLGIDLAPVDATTDDGLRLLDAFVRRDDYRLHLRRGAEVMRHERPDLVRGDYLEALPRVLRDRDAHALTVVYQTISTVYLSDEERVRLRVILEEAGAEGPLAWISTPTPEEHGERRGDYPLELALWPGGERRIVARMNVRGEWLEWIG